MSEEVQALTIPAPITDGPIVVVAAEILTKINELGAQAVHLSVINTDVENEAAAAMLKVVTQMLNELEDNASAANKPYYEIQKMITKAKQTATKPLEAIKANLKNSLTQFILKRDRERAEAEAAAAKVRAAEAAALAEINAKRAAEAAAQGAPAPAPLPMPVPDSQAIIAKPASAKADATKITRKMVCKIVDAYAVPRAYCIPDVGLIEAAYKRGEITPEVHPFFVVEEVVSVSAK